MSARRMEGWKVLKTLREGGKGTPSVVKKWRIRAQSNLRRYDQDRLIKSGGPDGSDLLARLMKVATERTEIPGGVTPFTEFTKKKFELSQKAGATPETGAQQAVAKSQQMRQAAEAKAPQIKPITGFRKAAEEEIMTFEESFLKGFTESFGKEGSVCKTPGEKIRSKGKGRGRAVGGGKGPMGIPIGEKRAGLFTMLKEGSISTKIQAAKADPSTKANPKDTGPAGSGLQDPRVKAQQAKMKTGLFGK